MEATTNRPKSSNRISCPEIVEKKRNARDCGYDAVSHRFTARQPFYDGIVAGMLDRGWNPASHLEQWAVELLEFSRKINQRGCDK